jgi:hypothetical protein
LGQKSCGLFDSSDPKIVAADFVMFPRRAGNEVFLAIARLLRWIRQSLTAGVDGEARPADGLGKIEQPNGIRSRFRDRAGRRVPDAEIGAHGSQLEQVRADRLLGQV